MSSFSPEQDEATAALVRLRPLIDRIDPIQHAARGYLSMSDDERTVTNLVESDNSDRERAIINFEELATAFNDDYMMSDSFLAELWDVDEREVPWPADDSQSAASYFTSYKSEEFKVTITRWMQPNPRTKEIEEMMGACIDPMWSLSPTIRVVYLGKQPLISCKYSQLEVSGSVRADWSDTGTLTPDDVMTAEKVIKRVTLHAI